MVLVDERRDYDIMDNLVKFGICGGYCWIILVGLRSSFLFVLQFRNIYIYVCMYMYVIIMDIYSIRIVIVIVKGRYIIE